MGQQRANSEPADESDTDARNGEDSGRTSLADEFRMLLEAVTPHLDRAAARSDTANSRTESANSRVEEGLCGHSAENADTSTCSWCPLCAALSLIRARYPELARLVVERFADIAAMLRQAVTDNQPAASDSAGPESAAPDSSGQDERAAGKIQQIAVHRVNGSLREAGEC